MYNFKIPLHIICHYVTKLCISEGVKNAETDNIFLSALKSITSC